MTVEQSGEGKELCDVHMGKVCTKLHFSYRDGPLKVHKQRTQGDDPTSAKMQSR